MILLDFILDLIDRLTGGGKAQENGSQDKPREPYIPSSSSGNEISNVRAIDRDRSR